MKQTKKRVGLKPSLKVASVIGIVLVLFPIVVRQVRRAQTDPGGVRASELVVGLVVVGMILTIVAVMRLVLAPVLRKKREIEVASGSEGVVLVGHRYEGVIEALQVLASEGPRRVSPRPMGTFFPLKFDHSGVSFFSSEVGEEAICFVPWSDVKKVGPGVVSMWSGDVAALALTVRSGGRDLEFAVVIGSRFLWGAMPRSEGRIDDLIVNIASLR
jgi:hypothetical protein